MTPTLQKGSVLETWCSTTRKLWRWGFPNRSVIPDHLWPFRHFIRVMRTKNKDNDDNKGLCWDTDRQSQQWKVTQIGCFPILSKTSNHSSVLVGNKAPISHLKSFGISRSDYFQYNCLIFHITWSIIYVDCHVEQCWMSQKCPFYVMHC